MPAQWTVLPLDDPLPIADRDDCLFYMLGDQQHFHVGVRRVRSQLNPLLEVYSHKNPAQASAIVFVQGPSCSGKTTEARVVVPWLLAPHMRQLRAAATVPSSTTFYPDLEPQFAYVDCLLARSCRDVKSKLAMLWERLKKELGDTSPAPARPTVTAYQELLRDLVRSVPRYTIVTVDEYNMLFAGLSPRDIDDMALFMRDLLLSPDSPCQFVVTGSTSAAVVQAALISPSNGADLWTGSATVVTDTESDERALRDVYALLSAGAAEAPPLNAICDAVRAQLTYVNCGAVAQCLQFAEPGDRFGDPAKGADLLRDRILANYARDFAYMLESNSAETQRAHNIIFEYMLGSAADPGKLRDLVERRSPDEPYIWKDTLFRAYFYAQQRRFSGAHLL
eukprot:m51a1_g3567 hypothetical protein (393) ;mRNA; r:1079211-1080465